jgi:hypothetical protein
VVLVGLGVVNMSNNIETPTPVEEPIIYYGVFDADGKPTAFYNSDIYKNEAEARSSKIPAEAVEITHDQWMELLSDQTRARYVNGEVVMIEPPPIPPPPPNPLDEIKTMFADMNERLKKLESR